MVDRNDIKPRKMKSGCTIDMYLSGIQWHVSASRLFVYICSMDNWKR